MQSSEGKCGNKNGCGGFSTLSLMTQQRWGSFVKVESFSKQPRLITWLSMSTLPSAIPLDDLKEETLIIPWLLLLYLFL